MWDNNLLISVYLLIAYRLRNNFPHKKTFSTESASRTISYSFSQWYSDHSSELLKTIDTENKRKMIAENRSWWHWNKNLPVGQTCMELHVFALLPQGEKKRMIFWLCDAFWNNKIKESCIKIHWVGVETVYIFKLLFLKIFFTFIYLHYFYITVIKYIKLAREIKKYMSRER